jgi:protein TonB
MFDNALLESQRQRKGRGKGIGLPLAIGFHAAVLGAFVGASVWHTEEPAEPVIPVTFFLPPAGPPPPIGTGGSVRAHTSQPRPHEPAAFPRVMSAVPQPSEDTRESAGPEYPGEQSGPPGDRNGVRNVTGDGPVAGPSSADFDPIYQPGGGVTPPELLQRIEPVYTEAARRAHLEGIVILEAIITASGNVEEIRVMRSANALFDEAAERAVRQWRYKPATLNGRAVRVYLTVTVRFDLRS